jgi:inhibitor of KinA sporulation pathway (predicted exonuclease)
MVKLCVPITVGVVGIFEDRHRRASDARRIDQLSSFVRPVNVEILTQCDEACILIRWGL